MRHRGIKYIIAAARKTWRWSEERRQVKNRCRQGKDNYMCELCKAIVDRVDIDHIEPIGSQPVQWSEFGSWLERLFCPASNLQGLCKKCHASKTLKERKERSEKRRKRLCKTATHKLKTRKITEYA